MCIECDLLSPKDAAAVGADGGAGGEEDSEEHASIDLCESCFTENKFAHMSINETGEPHPHLKFIRIDGTTGEHTFVSR